MFFFLVGFWCGCLIGGGVVGICGMFLVVGIDECKYGEGGGVGMVGELTSGVGFLFGEIGGVGFFLFGIFLYHFLL